MKFYIAARYSRIVEANQIAKELKSLGHSVTSTWITNPFDDRSERAPHRDQKQWALKDLEDLKESEVCLSLMETPRPNSRGGRHVEFGMAAILGKALVIIGERETIFHHLPQVVQFGTVEEFFEYLKS